MSNAAAAAAKSLQSCPTLCNPIDGSPPKSNVCDAIVFVSNFFFFLNFYFNKQGLNLEYQEEVSEINMLKS